ncbi:MAG: mannose-1-phosphate guanylyltransferase [Saprospiraceae bacterium]
MIDTKLSNQNNYIAIMAGGVGTRFWPASRTSKPKQFLDILDIGSSLLQMTYYRACKIVPSENVIIVSNKNYKSLIQEQLPGLNANQILLEPSMNNTAPCVLYTALHLKAKNVNSCFAVIPSDHMILKEDIFIKKMHMAFEYASNHNAIVTLGIQPTRPDTGYGYINYRVSDKSVLDVIEFKEKPDMETAQQYVDSGEYLWNAGIFAWSVGTIIQSFEQNAPDILKVLNEKEEHYGTENEQKYIDRVYPNTRNISVDFAILEKSKNVKTIPSDIGWSDLGTWNSLYNYLDRDGNDNVVQSERTKLIDSKGNLIRSKKLVVIKGLEDYIIVDDDNILLIYPRSEEQQIKEIRNNLDYPELK